MVNGKIAIDEETAEIIIRLLQIMIQENTAKEMTTGGIPTVNKKSNWNHGTVGKIFKNVECQGDELFP